jgi:RNAse (barnase) inhibitor barstar
MRSVTFTDDAPDLEGFEILRIEGDSIESKEELLDTIAEGFGFPDWFGRNWDALEECLRDLDAVNDGYALVISNATAIWAEHPRISGTLVEVWLDAAADGAERGVELRLVFEW